MKNSKYECEITTHGTTNTILSNNLTKLKARLRQCENATAIVRTEDDTTKYIIKDYRIVDSYEYI